MNNKVRLLAILTQQVSHAFGFDGQIGPEAQKEREKAIKAANATLKVLETKFGLDPEEVLEGVIASADF